MVKSSQVKDLPAVPEEYKRLQEMWETARSVDSRAVHDVADGDPCPVCFEKIALPCPMCLQSWHAHCCDRVLRTRETTLAATMNVYRGSWDPDDVETDVIASSMGLCCFCKEALVIAKNQ